MNEVYTKQEAEEAMQPAGKLLAEMRKLAGKLQAGDTQENNQ